MYPPKKKTDRKKQVLGPLRRVSHYWTHAGVETETTSTNYTGYRLNSHQGENFWDRTSEQTRVEAIRLKTAITVHFDMGPSIVDQSDAWYRIVVIREQDDNQYTPTWPFNSILNDTQPSGTPVSTFWAGVNEGQETQGQILYDKCGVVPFPCMPSQLNIPAITEGTGGASTTTWPDIKKLVLIDDYIKVNKWVQYTSAVYNGGKAGVLRVYSCGGFATPLDLGSQQKALNYMNFTHQAIVSWREPL